jgi:hypothetical protein
MDAPPPPQRSKSIQKRRSIQAEATGLAQADLATAPVSDDVEPMGAEPWRQSGRTTAMLEQARARVSRGDCVVILVPDVRMVGDFKSRLPASERLLIVSTSQAHHVAGRGIDAVFVDHSAWETLPFETARFLVAVEPRVNKRL